MKVTVFVNKSNRLVAIQRAGGVEGKKCEHTFPISGLYAGVVGEAFQQESAVPAYNLPDLNSLPTGKKGKEQRKKLIGEYAVQVYQSTAEIETELKHKKSHGRLMPRSVYALRVRSAQHNKTLGVIVVDSTNLSLTSDQEKLVGDAGEALRPSLLRLR